MLGQTTGAIKAINDLGILTSEQKKEAYAEAIRSAIEKRPKPQVADVSHYVNELTSFFQAFPLCKGRALFDTFSALAPIWTGIARQTLSYQTVGRDCGK
jgi:hypothetical protein